MNWRIVWDGDIPRIIVTTEEGVEVPLSELFDCGEVHDGEVVREVSCL